MQTRAFYRSFTDMNIWEFFTNSWRMYGAHFQAFLLLNAIYVMIAEGVHFLAIGPLVEIISGCMLGLTSVAMTIAAHKASDGETTDIGQIYALSLSWRRLSQYILTLILYSLIVFGGFILFIIPGLIWGARYALAPHAVIVEGLNARQALSRSAVLTSGKKLCIWRYELVFGLLFGLFISLPIMLIIHWLALPLGEQFQDLLQALHIIIGNTLFIIFNVLLFKSLRIALSDSQP